MSNDQIGAALYISLVIAKPHVNRTMAKLGARDRAQPVIPTCETGLVRDCARQADPPPSPRLSCPCDGGR